MVGERVRRCTPLARAISHIGLAFFFALSVFVVCQIPQTAAQSGRPGDGHAEMHDRYKGWSPPGNPGVSCCNDSDCRPTRAYLTESGWRAWNGQTWLLVPGERVLPTDYAGDGRSHLCEKGEYIYCFTPGQVRG